MHSVPSHRRAVAASLAAGWLACGHIGTAWPQAAAPGAGNQAPVTVEAAEIRARPDADVAAEGDVLLRQGPTEIRADKLSYDQRTDVARGTGKVRISRDGNVYSGPELQLQLQRFEGYFISPSYFFSRTEAGGTASRVDFLGRDLAVTTGATYTSCPRDGPQEPAWVLSADRVKMDFATNEGEADGAVLRFYGVPILAAPHMSFPLSDDRKSGWLPPNTALDSKSGLLLAVPYYWNLAPNRDATLTPIVYSKRGVGLGTEFRYLEPGYAGSLNLNVLANDRLTGQSRGSLGLEHEGVWWRDGVYKATVARVSDDDYWKDFPHDWPGLTPRLLAADVSASKGFGSWNTYARVLRWQVLQGPLSQTLSEQIYPVPYDREPQLGVRGTQRLGGLEVALETEFNRFSNPDGTIQPLLPDGTTAALPLTGSRVHALGSVSWPYVTPGWALVPKVSVNAAAYEVDRPLSEGRYAGQTRVNRAIPTLSLDSAWTLERETEWFGRATRQTLEPRLLFVKTPFSDQTGLPNFDSAAKDFNFDSIYTDNAFSGIDRVSDAFQVTAGATTRVVDAQTGAEAFRLGLAQRFLFSDQRITADGQPLTQRVSDLLLVGSTTLIPRWQLDAGLQYSPNIQRTMRSVLGLRYSPGPYRTINAAYRFKRDTNDQAADGTEQAELGWQWPLYGPVRTPGARSMAQNGSCSGTWYSVGRVNYSLRDSRVTDAVLGLEYDSGCWIGRVVAKRLSTSQAEATTQLGFEIEFVGLSRLGTNPLKVLKDNIPGYRLLRDDTPIDGNRPTAP
ncbi:LPS-assembly protein LptD [Sphaerotilaceae bacterium SBD11-9]